MSEDLTPRDQFTQDLAKVDWKDFRVHLQRDAIILVDAALDIIDVAVDIAADNSDQVSLWIAAGKLTKPTKEQIDLWEGQLDKPFKVLIAQPYILAQPVCHA